MDNVYIIEIKKIDKQKVVFTFSCPIRSCTATNKSFQRIFPHEERSLKSLTQVVNQSTRSGNSFIEQLLEN
jgi:capsid portal protein